MVAEMIERIFLCVDGRGNLCLDRLFATETAAWDAFVIHLLAMGGCPPTWGAADFKKCGYDVVEFVRSSPRDVPVLGVQRSGAQRAVDAPPAECDECAGDLPKPDPNTESRVDDMVEIRGVPFDPAWKNVYGYEVGCADPNAEIFNPVTRKFE